MASGSSTKLSKWSCNFGIYLLRHLPMIILMEYAYAVYRGRSFEWLSVVIHIVLDQLIIGFLSLTKKHRSNVSTFLKVSFKKFVYGKKSHNA